MKTELLYGVHAVTEALKAGRRDFLQAYLADDRRGRQMTQVTQWLAQRHVACKHVPAAQLNRMVGAGRHQGVVLRAGLYPLADREALWQTLAGSERPFVLVLDGIEDPHNLGALVRTAVAAGVDAIVIPKKRSASPTPTVAHVSAGALEHVLMVQVPNLVDLMKRLQQRGVWIFGLAGDGGATVFDCDLTVPVALAVGREGKGLHRLVRATCDMIMAIPRQGGVDSLNASVAGAIAMYEVFRQRHPVA